MSVTCRDAEDLVALEAIKSMFGTVHSGRRLVGPAAAAEEASTVKLRVRAWLLLSTFVSNPPRIACPTA